MLTGNDGGAERPREELPVVPNVDAWAVEVSVILARSVSQGPVLPNYDAAALYVEQRVNSAEKVGM